MRPTRVAVWLVFFACLVLFVALRARGVGHLLMWDEAQDVIAARALADGSGDGFTPRLWAHPPALPTLALLMQPLKSGFAERYEMLVLSINACAMIALFLLNRRIFGTTVALWSAFFIAVMPGAVFYDVWIKGGSVVSLATLGAVAALMGGRPLLSGLCLGFALLDKELALLPCCAVGILALLDQRHRNAKTIAGLVVATGLAAGWWYLFLSSTVVRWLSFATGRSWDPSCDEPWYSYFVWGYGDSGAVGCVLVVAGLAWMVMRRNQHASDSVARPYAWWPLLTVVTTYGVFTACRAKSPWFAMFVYPALATLQALGMAGMVATCAARFPRLRPLALAGSVLCGAFMLYVVAVPESSAKTSMEAGIAANFPIREMAHSRPTPRPASLAHRIWSIRFHEQHQFRVMPGAWVRAARTFAIATAVNTRIAPKDRLFTTTLSFHGVPVFDVTSPLFVYYLTNMPLHMVSCTSSFDTCAALIADHRLEWALVTPIPGAPASAMTNGFKTRFNLDPIILDNGTSFLYWIKSAYQRGME